MKNTKMFLITAVILVLLFIVAYTTVNGPKPIEIKTYDMDVSVASGKVVGVNVDADAIHFGKVPVDQTAESMRGINVMNGEIKTNVQLRTTGILGKWVSVSQNNFTLEPKQTHTINVTATIPGETPLGNYTGTLIIEFFKAE